MKIKSISPSQLDAMSCRFAWYLGYRKGYKPRRSSVALEFGTGIHYALERYYGHEENPVQAFKKWMKRRMRELSDFPDDAMNLGDQRDLGIAMLEGYLKEYPTDDFKVVATEKFLQTPLIPPTENDPPVDCVLSARLDGLVIDEATGMAFSLEHKTFSQFSPGFLDRDHQMTAQVWLGRELAAEMGVKEDVAGVIYNGLRKQAPGPRVRNRLFERHKVYRNPTQIAVFLHRAYHQVLEFSQKGLAIYPQPNLVRCNQCDFEGVCRAYMLGEDWKFILRELYDKR